MIYKYVHPPLTPFTLRISKLVAAETGHKLEISDHSAALTFFPVCALSTVEFNTCNHLAGFDSRPFGPGSALEHWSSESEPCLCLSRATLVANLPAMWGTWVWSLGWEDPLEKGTHSSSLAWRIPRTEEPGRLQSTGSQRVGHDWVTFTFHFFLHVTVRSDAAWRLPTFKLWWPPTAVGRPPTWGPAWWASPPPTPVTKGAWNTAKFPGKELH